MTSPLERLEARWRALREQPAFQAGLVFAGAAWFVLQVADVLGFPLGLVRSLAVLLLLLFAGLAIFAVARTRAGSPEPLRRRRWVRVAPVAALALLLLGTAAWWLRPRLVQGAVRPGAEVIAVLPFSTSGQGIDLPGEGLVDLLARDLDGVEGIRVIDPRTALYRWRRSGGDALDLPAALHVGRDLGAGSVLTGTAVAAGGEVRVSADLIGIDGHELASAEATGSADSVLSLVDRLSTDVLRRIWRAREPWPTFRLSAVTTTSPDALRAYLRGERFFRASQWDSAAAAFESAIQEDSTFALAYMRLGTSYGWTEFLGSPHVTGYADAAWRLAHRLPPRERSLVGANRLHEQGDLAALDSLQRFVTLYPDDADGWELLGDAQLHSVEVTGRPLASPRYAFDHAIALDSSAAPAYMHPLDLALMLGDSVTFDRHMEGFARSAAPEQVGFYRNARALRWGPNTRSAEVISEALRATPASAEATWLGLLLNAGDGAAFFSPTAAGLAPARTAPRTLAHLDSIPLDRGITYWQSAVALSAGEVARARALLDSPLASDSSADPIPPPACFRALRAWATIADGDTLGGLAALRAGVMETGYDQRYFRTRLPLLVTLARTQAARPEGRVGGSIA